MQLRDAVEPVTWGHVNGEWKAGYGGEAKCWLSMKDGTGQWVARSKILPVPAFVVACSPKPALSPLFPDLGSVNHINQNGCRIAIISSSHYYTLEIGVHGYECCCWWGVGKSNSPIALDDASSLPSRLGRGKGRVPGRRAMREWEDQG